MRAWQTIKTGRPADVLELRSDVPEPRPTAGTVQVEVAAAGIGRPDALMCLGSYAMTPPLPFTQGQEVAGRVVAGGPGVEGRRAGERVMAVTSFFTGHGSFAEQCLALDDFCLPIPDDMSDVEAAGFLIPMHTAYIGLSRRGGLQPGETLLVLGAAGGTGSAAVQVGRALGARVIATAGGRDKVAFCESLGADHVVDYRRDDIAKAVRSLTGGRGAEVVYDTVGGEAYQRATRCIAHEGRILVVGFGSGSWAEVETPHLVNRNYSVIGVIPTGYDRAFKEAAHERLIGWWRAGEIRSVVDEAVPFANLPGALERLLEGGVRGKLVLAVEPARNGSHGDHAGE